MSYTMTIDEPKEAAWFEETSRTMTPSELGALFVVFLRQQVNRPKSFAEKWRTAVRKRCMPLMMATVRSSTRPVMLAAAEAHGCDTILTEDLNDGQIYAGVKAVNPFT